MDIKRRLIRCSAALSAFPTVLLAFFLTAALVGCEHLPEGGKGGRTELPGSLTAAFSPTDDANDQHPAPDEADDDTAPSPTRTPRPARTPPPELIERQTSTADYEARMAAQAILAPSPQPASGSQATSSQAASGGSYTTDDGWVVTHHTPQPASASQAASQATPSPFSTGDDVADVLNWLNAQRAARGLPHFVYADTLAAMAQTVAGNLAARPGDVDFAYAEYRHWSAFGEGDLWKPVYVNWIEVSGTQDFLLTFEHHLPSMSASFFDPDYTHIGLGYSRQSGGMELRFMPFILGKPAAFLTATPPPKTASAYKHDFDAWMVGACAILAARNNNNPYTFGLGHDRQNALSLLRDGSWNIPNKARLTSVVNSMTHDGHNARFAEAYALVSSLSADELSFLVQISSGADVYMWPYTKQLGDKWGDRQIKAWDWFRMFHIVGWGYTAGFVTKDEAYELLEPVIELLLENFDNWEQANQNYLDGYIWWSRTDTSQRDPELQRRLNIYDKIKDDRHLFDPAVWR